MFSHSDKLPHAHTHTFLSISIRNSKVWESFVNFLFHLSFDLSPFASVYLLCRYVLFTSWWRKGSQLRDEIESYFHKFSRASLKKATIQMNYLFVFNILMINISWNSEICQGKNASFWMNCEINLPQMMVKRLNKHIKSMSLIKSIATHRNEIIRIKWKNFHVINIASPVTIPWNMEFLCSKTVKIPWQQHVCRCKYSWNEHRWKQFALSSFVIIRFRTTNAIKQIKLYGKWRNILGWQNENRIFSLSKLQQIHCSHSPSSAVDSDKRGKL